jgi:hypothetical protein
MESMNLTVPIEEPDWGSAPAWKLPGWGEPVVRNPWANVCPYLLTGDFTDGRKHFSSIDDNQQKTRLPNI